MPNYLIPPASWTPTASGGTGGDELWFGNDFYTTSTGVQVGAIGWYRGNTTDAAPLTIYVRDTVANTDLVTLTPPDDGLIGWHYVNVTSPPTLIASRMYRVGLRVPGGVTVYWQSSFTPEASWHYETAHFGHYWPTYEGTPGHPYGVSVADGPISGPPTPGDTTTIITTPGAGAEPLAPWLSSDATTQTHETDGLPWLTKQQTDSIQSLIGALTDVANAAGSLMARTAKLAQDTAELLARVPALVINGIAESFAQLFTWFGGVPKPAGAPTIPEHLSGIDDQLLALAGQVAQLAGNVEQLQAPMAGFPTDFELVDSFTFTDCVAWNVAADVYVLHVTDVPHGMAISDMCGVPMLRRCGWWATLNDTLPGERHYLDFEFNLISQPGGRMPGVLIELGQEGAGIIEAYDRLPPPIGP